MAMIWKAGLALLSLLEVAGRFQPDTEFKYLGLVMPLYLDFHAGFDRTFKEDGLKCERSALAYARHNGLKADVIHGTDKASLNVNGKKWTNA